MCRLVGQPKALAAALGEVARIVRSNPAKEKPGGPPPSLSQITGAPSNTSVSALIMCWLCGGTTSYPFGTIAFAGIPVGPQAGGLALAAAGRYHGASHGMPSHSGGGGASTTVTFKVQPIPLSSLLGCLLSGGHSWLHEWARW